MTYKLYDMSERLNARIDEELARKLAALRRRLKLSTTEVLRRSIEHYYQAAFPPGGTPAEIIEASGLVGSATGPADLSSRYKELLARSLSSKT